MKKNPASTVVVDQIVEEIKNIENADIKIIVGDADEFYMDGSYDNDDRHFVWYQVPTNENVRTERLVAKFKKLEDSEKYAIKIIKGLTNARQNNKCIGTIIYI